MIILEIITKQYDLSGKLGFDSFRGLWTDLAWCKVLRFLYLNFQLFYLYF